jgi:trehalose 6-phosphate phosphatase
VPVGGGEVALDAWLDDPDHAGILTDFDGTLAPIVADPLGAAPLPGAVEVLGVLARRYARVGVVSGRTVAYLAAQLAPVADGLVLSGLYGLERVEAGATHLRPGARRWEEAVEAVAARAEQEAPPGVGIERKGLTVTLHARTAPEHLDWVSSWAAAAAAEAGLVADPGRMTTEIRPPIRVDKGTVVGELAVGLRAVCFIGDDVGDLPAFAALGDLREAGVTTLAVAARSDESPPALIAGADVVVDGPDGVLALLRRLAA